MNKSLIAARPVLHLHAKPSTDEEVTSQLIYGVAAELVQDRGHWLQVRTSDTYTGWALRQEFHVQEQESAKRAAHVDQLTANVYRVPDVKRQAPLLQLPWEARLAVHPDQADVPETWLRVCLLHGEVAYVQRGDVTLHPATLALEQMLALALRFLGVTYTWGGVSSFGFDCSGFVQMLFRQRGILLPRDTQAQVQWEGFHAVPATDLAPGDVVFFGESLQDINHVGLFLRDGRFIHDTTQDHPGVQISALDQEPWKSRLAAQRRLRA